MDWNVYVVERERRQCYLSPLPHEVVFDHGLPSQAVAGEVFGEVVQRATTNDPGEIKPEQFAQNSAFVQFLHASLARHAPHCPGVLQEAARQRDGWVYIIDGRSPDPQGTVPPEDVIGKLEVVDGRVTGQYAGSKRHRILGSHGLMQLDPWLEERFMQDLHRLCGRAPHLGAT